MEIKGVRRIVYNMLAILVIVTIFFYFYSFVNPLDFPGVVKKLVIFDILAGLVLFSLYMKDFYPVLKKKVKTKIKIPVHLKKTNYQFTYKKHYRIRHFNLMDFIKLLVSFIRENKFILYMLSLFISIVGYSIFLLIIYKKVGFDEFIFFILIIYVFTSFKLRLDSRYPIIAGLVLLGMCIPLLSVGLENQAKAVAIYSYYFFVIGLVLMFIEYLKNNPRSEKM